MTDLTQIAEILGLANTAASATGKAADTAASIRAHFSKEKPADNSETANLLNALAAELTSANMMNVQLSDALKALGNELRQQDQFAAEVARYELFQTGQDAMVYKLKEDQSNGEPMHFICPVCMKRDQLISYITGTGEYKVCQTDTAHTFRFEQGEDLNRRLRKLGSRLA